MMPKCIPTSIPAPRSTLDGQKVTKILQKLNNWRPIGAEIVDFDRHLSALWDQRRLQNLIFLLKIQEKCSKFKKKYQDWGKKYFFGIPPPILATHRVTSLLPHPPQILPMLPVRSLRAYTRLSKMIQYSHFLSCGSRVVRTNWWLLNFVSPK